MSHRRKGSEAPSQAATRHHHTHNPTLSPPLRSPDCASKKEHDTDVSSPPESGDLGFHLAGDGRRGRIHTTASKEGNGAQGVAFGVTAAPARGFPRIQPRPTRSAQPATGSSGLSHQDPDLAKEGADQSGGDGLHQWHTCGEGCTPATVDRRHLVTRKTEEVPSSHRQGGPPPGPPHPHLPGPPPRVPRPCPRRAAAESPPPPSSVSSARRRTPLAAAEGEGRGEEGAAAAV